MTTRLRKTVTLRSAGNTEKGKTISQEPEMKKLIETSKDMTGEEKTRTEHYLKDQDSNNTHLGDKN